MTQSRAIDGIKVASVALTFAAVVYGFIHADRAENSKLAPGDESITECKPAIVETVKAEPVEVLPIIVKATPIEEEESKIEFMAFDVPLEDELQLHILIECEKHGIDPAIITAMAFCESNYQSNAIGDNGKSFGLLQIQKRYQEERMENLGCTNLLDPYQNVTVGVDILAELVEMYEGNIEKALTAYNCGPTGAYNNFFSKGIYSNNYAKKVLEKCQELQSN